MILRLPEASACSWSKGGGTVPLVITPLAAAGRRWARRGAAAERFPGETLIIERDALGFGPTRLGYRSGPERLYWLRAIPILTMSSSVASRRGQTVRPPGSDRS